ncbi:hypothetical protein ACEQ8H_007103 [Pleosporales sp. CAS-2024a]
MSAPNPNSLAKRNASSALMAPPPAPKRIKRPTTVLDEDTYVSAISHIIRRDFFPGLAEADAQREYLNAVESKDKSWIREAGRKLTQAMTALPSGRRRVSERTRFDRPGGSMDKTPSVWGADTPVTVAPSEPEDNEEGLGKLDNVDLNMSLGAFQAKYTSEDQESFSRIIDKQNAKKFEKNAWLRDGNMYASKQRLAQQKVLQACAANESKDVVLATRPSQDLDARPAAPTGTKHTAFNSLMFAPDSVESWAPTRASVAESASLAPPKQVLYNNTRLPAAADGNPPRPSSPTLSSIRAAVSGNPRLNPSEGGFTGSETPRVKGYAFVDAYPPSEDEDEDDNPPTDLLSRYGIASTSKATPFTIREASAREKMHHKMVESIGAKRNDNNNNNNNKHAKTTARGGLGIFSSSDTPRFLSAPTPRAAGLLAVGMTPGTKAKGDLTPAAQRLFESMGAGTPRPSHTVGFGHGAGKAGEWTPLNRVKRKM